MIDKPIEKSAATRRTDLDALRGFAMALGIILHASLSFFPSAWPVQDVEQSGYFYLFYAAIHSFRMPLFFVLSGFFTAFLLQRNGLEETVRQRALRILLPMLLALATIVPLNNFISDIAIERTRAPRGEADPMVSAILRNDAETVRREFARLGRDWTDSVQGFNALYWAALAGHPEMVDLFLKEGFESGWRSPSGSTPLHAAALFANDRAVAVLLENGADPAATDSRGILPFQQSIAWATFAPAAATSLGLPDVSASDWAHLPLVMAAQLAVAFLPWPPAVKFLLVNAAVMAVLLASYQWFVRYTWIGALLNGPRKKQG